MDMDTIKIMRAISCKLRDAHEKQSWDDILKIIELLEDSCSIAKSERRSPKPLRPIIELNLNTFLKERRLIENIQNTAIPHRLSEHSVTVKMKNNGRTEKSIKRKSHRQR